MFTGIIETIGTLHAATPEGNNLHLTIQSTLAPLLKIDQSLAHNGICLTVTHTTPTHYQVTAVHETIQRTNIAQLQIGDSINLERAITLGSPLDGHIVQGHIDTTAICTHIIPQQGSWLFTFQYPPDTQQLLIPKGSIAINGVSLTVVQPHQNTFSVAIIPYTYHHTTFRHLQVGHHVNLEFDILGKYILQYLKQYQQPLNTT